MSNTYAVIMAGGVGSRFWPKSRKSLPKQYLNLIGDETMIQMAARRLKRLVAEENVLIVTTEDQADLVKDQLPWIPEDNLIFEPFGKNTAPCIGLSAIHIKHLDPNAAMIVCPADHLISNSEKYLSILADGVKLVKSDPNSLVTIGIEPTYASTGYGYIQSGEPVAGEIKGAYKVQAFAEKPTTEVARQFFSSGEFLWNSGIFIWNVETILNYIEELMPDLYDGLLKIRKSYR